MTGGLVLVDSSYFITLLRRGERPFEALDEFLDDYDFATCGTVWIEVVRGRVDPAVRRKFEERLATMVFLELTPAAWQRTAGLAWEMDRRGQVIPATDLTIAACAMEHRAAVLTFDKHFRDVPGLQVVDVLV